jgi:hypothetical protein
MAYVTAFASLETRYSRVALFVRFDVIYIEGATNWHLSGVDMQ